MKILLFTHKNDIDGMGSVVLSKLVFDNLDYELCETYSLGNYIDKHFNDNSIYKYDKIFITDLCPDKEYVEKFMNDDKLKNKVVVFDHHKTYIDFNKYNFVNIKVSNDKGLCCGTSLFYDYLIENKLLEYNNKIDEFVSLTRQHDTWEWKNIYNNEKARELSLLLDMTGPSTYIKFMYDKLSNENIDKFDFNEIELNLIECKKNIISSKIDVYKNNIYYRDLFGYRVGIVFINYEYRNELAEYLKQNNFDMDLVMLICLDYGTISYRSVKDDVNVRKIAEYFGGKGHDKAGGNPISENKNNKIINLLLKK